MAVAKVGMLDGNSASFKGGRDYVHATDIIPELEAFGRDQFDGAVLERIEFHSPLRRRGLLLFLGRSDEFEKTDATATGSFLRGDGGPVHFLICSTPLQITDRDRTFDEKALAETAELGIDGAGLKMPSDGRHSMMEHISASMKRLCQAAVPNCRRWWFARLTKEKLLPAEFQEIELRLKRVTLGRFVAAEITIDQRSCGQIEFVGTSG